MAQAQILSIKNEEAALASHKRDAKLARAFREMESDLHDLRYMASIAFEQASETAEDIYAGRLGDRRDYDRMVFAISHVEKMVNDLYRKWDSGLHG